jgi:hypothetical protein
MRGGMVCRGTLRGTGGRAVSLALVSAGVAVGRGARGGMLGRCTGGVMVTFGIGVVTASGVDAGLIVGPGVVGGNDGGDLRRTGGGV